MPAGVEALRRQAGAQSSQPAHQAAVQWDAYHSRGGRRAGWVEWGGGHVAEDTHRFDWPPALVVACVASCSCIQQQLRRPGHPCPRRIVQRCLCARICRVHQRPRVQQRLDGSHEAVGRSPHERCQRVTIARIYVCARTHQGHDGSNSILVRRRLQGRVVVQPLIGVGVCSSGDESRNFTHVIVERSTAQGDIQLIHRLYPVCHGGDAASVPRCRAPGVPSVRALDPRRREIRATLAWCPTRPRCGPT
jgi:hypothetical protein